MLFTPQNIDRYFRHDRVINVPHKDVFSTLAFHALAVIAVQVLYTRDFFVIGLILTAAEAYTVYSVVYRMWRKVGYSKKLFKAGGIIYLLISFAIASFIRIMLTGRFF